jgi:hypothetical protein
LEIKKKLIVEPFCFYPLSNNLKICDIFLHFSGTILIIFNKLNKTVSWILNNIYQHQLFDIINKSNFKIFFNHINDEFYNVSSKKQSQIFKNFK